MNWSIVKKIANLALGSLLISYPFVIYFFAKEVSASFLVGGLMAVLLLRALIKKEKLPLAVAGIMGVLYYWHGDIAGLYYPVVMNSSFALLLIWTLIFPPSLIEVFARAGGHDLGEEGVIYTRKVTIVWVVFSTFNTLASLITVWLNDHDIWVLYNGFISYLLMSLLFGGEYLYRLNLQFRDRK